MKKFFRYVTFILMIAVVPALGFAQQRTFTGLITDGNNNPLSGVTILIDQSNSGTSTGPDGRFSLTAPENANLVISSTGYQSVTMDTRGGKNDFEIKLEEDVARLDEVL